MNDCFAGPVNAFEFIGRFVVVEGIEFDAGNLSHRNVLIAHTRKARPVALQTFEHPGFAHLFHCGAARLDPFCHLPVALAQPFLAGFSTSIRSSALQWTAKRFFTSCVENLGD